MRAELFARRIAALSCGLLLCCAWAVGGEVTLKDGTRLKGKGPVPLETVGVRSSRSDPNKPSPNQPVLLLEEPGAVQFFVPVRFAKEINREIDLRRKSSNCRPNTFPDIARSPKWRGWRPSPGTRTDIAW